MTIAHAIQAFFQDLKLQTALVVVFIDFVLGIIAALKLGKFRLSYVGDLARNDVLFKLLPWMVVYIGAKFAGHQQLVIPGIDLNVAADGLYVVIMAAWAGSLLASLAELGLPVTNAKAALNARVGKFPQWAAGSENAAPPKD